ncbi:MAG: hypothetical protein J1E82_02755 [Muribaculaceae bacterium]|nr:hypothetical protein [Muribaculaceae bacterium]
MIAQRTFKKAYADSLADNVKNGLNLHYYGEDSFPYDSEEVVIIPTVRHPEGLLEKMIPTPHGDFESAVALYEAYKDLSPLQASDRSFWTYLTHVDLFNYVQNRFPKVKEKDFNNVNYVINHWFHGSDWIKTHALASLWWYVFLTIDNNGTDKYKYTKIFFSSHGFRTNFIQYALARHKEAIFGYFDFLMENPDVTTQWFKAKNRFITKHFNKLGGTRLLSTLNRDFFKEELTRIKPQILTVTSTVKDEDDEDDI